MRQKRHSTRDWLTDDWLSQRLRHRDPKLCLGDANLKSLKITEPTRTGVGIAGKKLMIATPGTNVLVLKHPVPL